MLPANHVVSSVPSFMTTARVRLISASTAVIHNSTAPSTGTTVRKAKLSPSLDVMPIMLLLPRPNLSAGSAAMQSDTQCNIHAMLEACRLCDGNFNTRDLQLSGMEADASNHWAQQHHHMQNYINSCINNYIQQLHTIAVKSQAETNSSLHLL